MLKKIYNWIVLSSNDPSQVSLTIKGIGGLIVSTGSFWALLHLPVSPDSVTSIFDSFATLATQILGAVSTLATLYGMIRKLGLTILGQNKAILEQNKVVQ